jgi:hypothetical protein
MLALGEKKILPHEFVEIHAQYVVITWWSVGKSEARSAVHQAGSTGYITSRAGEY